MVPGEQVTAIINQEDKYQFMAGINDHLEAKITPAIAIYPRDVLDPMSIDELSPINDFICDKVLPDFTGFF
jgi:hypothetical protein